jgi:hypothetical protein
VEHITDVTQRFVIRVIDKQTASGFGHRSIIGQFASVDCWIHRQMVAALAGYRMWSREWEVNRERRGYYGEIKGEDVGFG